MKRPGLVMSATTRLSLELSQRYQQRLAIKWDQVVSDDLAFVPHEKRDNVSKEEAEAENKHIVRFGSAPLRRMCQRTTSQQKARRIRDQKKIVKVGFGKESYQIEDTLELETEAGFQTWWIDVSLKACAMASANMAKQSERLRAKGTLHPAPIVRQGEIRSVLAYPSKIGLDLSMVEVWEFCRTLTCLSELSAMFVLYELGNSSLSVGEDPDGNNRIIIVGAMKDHNPHRVGKTSKLYRIRRVLSRLAAGAGRPVELAEKEETTSYFTQIYSALVIKAKK